MEPDLSALLPTTRTKLTVISPLEGLRQKTAQTTVKLFPPHSPVFLQTQASSGATMESRQLSVLLHGNPKRLIKATTDLTAPHPTLSVCRTRCVKSLNMSEGGSWVLPLPPSPAQELLRRVSGFWCAIVLFVRNLLNALRVLA
jgi:hypothetical protein